MSERVRALLGEDPLGQRVTFSDSDDEGAWMTVVGVVGDVATGNIGAPDTRGTVYMPVTQVRAIDLFSPRTLAIRTESNPLELAGAVQRSIWGIDANQTVDNVRTLDSHIDGQLSGRAVQTTLFTTFGALALFMAALGIYGLLSYLVTSRRRELDVRTAVGAQRRDLVRLIARGSAAWVGWGLAAGLALAAVVSRSMASLVYGVEPLDGLSLAAAVCLLAIVGLMAALRPVWQATRVDPMAVLRAE